MSDECRFTYLDSFHPHWCETHAKFDAGIDAALCTHAAAALQARYKEAGRVLVRLGLVEHAGTWITRAEADRISKDGP